MTGALCRPLARAAGRRSGPDRDALEAIWEAVGSIPHGRVSTYGAVARAAGLPGRARQVGFALRVAAASLHLPWQRVVGAGGRIAFPRGSSAFREQRRRLLAEGVPLANGRVARSALLDPAEV
ncbi:MAG TPA: MGMT family protein [Steroidobacteraceae bacterium]|nr:MGMT family protein [Steroidobacteraceae bacterium]